MAFTFAGCLLGAGYVSGQELWQYFGSYGKIGLVGLVLSLILAGLSSWLVIWLSDNAKTGTVDRLIIRFDIPWLRAFVGVLFSLLYFVVAVIMFAGISSLCYQMFGINKVIGSAIATVLIMGTVYFGFDGMVKVFDMAVPVLVVAAIDGDSLGTVLAQAKEAGIPVIAYDRLIMNSDAVSYYATFDNWLVGVKQGEYIKNALDLENAEGPFNIEYITGDPGDNNINFFFDGAMSVLQEYVDSGKLVCQSGQVATLRDDGSYDKAVVATANWATDAAQARFEGILASNYADKQLDAVLASNDSTALGVENALAASYSNAVYPVITGQDCDIAIMKNLIEGRQGMSVFKDTRTLASKVVEMVDALMKGSEPPINDTKTYDNGTGIIPSFLCEPVACTVDNYKELLIDSGYYTEDQLAG